MGCAQHYPDKDAPEEVEKEYEEIQYESFEGYEIVKSNTFKRPDKPQGREEEV